MGKPRAAPAQGGMGAGRSPPGPGGASVQHGESVRGPLHSALLCESEKWLFLSSLRPQLYVEVRADALRTRLQALAQGAGWGASQSFVFSHTSNGAGSG